MNSTTFKKCIKKITGDGLLAHATFPWQVTSDRVDAWIDAARVRGVAVYPGGITTSGKSVSLQVDEGAKTVKFISRFQRVSGFVETYISGTVSLADALLMLAKGVELFMDDGYTEVSFKDDLAPALLAQLDALVARHNAVEGRDAPFPARRADPETDSIMKGEGDPARSIWLEGVFTASARGLLEAMNRVSAVVMIHSGFTFKIDGIAPVYEHEIVAMVKPKCPVCGRHLEVLAIDRWPLPAWGRAACQKCRKCYPMVSEGH
jgi:hypothetical protein